MSTQSSFPTVTILNVHVACMKLEQLIQALHTWVNTSERHTISYVNAHCLNLASTNALYRETLNITNLVYADGIGVVWASTFLGGCPLEKMTGADWIDHICEAATVQKWRIYILASAPGVAATAVHNLQRRYPTIAIVGYCDGFFCAKSVASVLEEIQTTKPDILFVGMGSPQQELWVAQHRNQLQAQVCWTVGALFDYVAGVEARAPRWMRRLALEWCWRLIVDPRGKWKRFLVGIPMFVARLVWYKFYRRD